MGIFTTQEGQSVFDIALQVYGDESKALKIAIDNNLDFNTNITGGIDVYFDDQINVLTDHLVNTDITISTDEAADESGKAFGDSFNSSFN